MRMGVLLVWLFPAILVAAAFGMPGCNEDSESSVSVMDRKIFGSTGPVIPAKGPLKIHPSNSRYRPVAAVRALAPRFEVIRSFTSLCGSAADLPHGCQPFSAGCSLI